MRSKSIYVFIALTLAFGGVLRADSVWTGTANGNWVDSANWSGGVPNATGAVADFTTVTPVTVTITDTQMVGTLEFGQTGTWTLTGGTLAIDNGTGAETITVASDTTAKITSALTSTGTINLSGGGTLQVSSASGVTGWSVTGATLEDVSESGSLGSGTIYLNDGATLRSANSKRRTLSNNIVFSGNTTIYSQGFTLNGELSGTGTITFMGGWNMAMKANPDLHADWLITHDFIQATEDGAFGTGKVTIDTSDTSSLERPSSAVGLLATYNNSTIANDIEVASNINFLVGGGLGYTSTLTGNLTGSGNIDMRSNQYRIVGTTNLQGDATGFSGNWTLHQIQTRDGTLDDVFTITTNNTNSTKADNGADQRFGSGTIYMGRAIVSPAANTDAYIHNNIEFNQDTTASSLDGQTATFSIPTGSSLTLTGQLSGTYPVLVTGGGALTLTGNNSGLSGAITLKDVQVNLGSASNPGNHFGTSSLTLDGATLAVGLGVNATIANNINVVSTSTISMPGWASGQSSRLTISGDITGSGDIIRSDGGYMVYLRGNNEAFEGNWQLKTDVINTNNSSPGDYTGADLRFGKGIIYGQGGGLCADGSVAYVDNDIIVQGGGILMRGTQFTLRGIVSLNGGDLKINSTVPNLVFTNTLMGTGTDNFASTFTSGATIAPGDSLDADHAITKGTGVLTFTQGLTLEAGSTLQMDMFSLESYDKIILMGNDLSVNLDGVTVDLNFLDNFDASGLEMFDTFDLLTGAELSGTPTLSYDINALLNAGAYDGARFMLTVNNGTLQLLAVNGAYVPEPASWLLLLSLVGGGGLDKT
ncbi:MAG: hypothetical protein Q4D98_14015 [Planctomycetia bacterium]|nr:hypothetical protein [Planctomycetia bacterium]